jgi:hypothetical protein
MRTPLARFLPALPLPLSTDGPCEAAGALLGVPYSADYKFCRPGD